MQVSDSRIIREIRDSSEESDHTKLNSMDLKKSDSGNDNILFMTYLQHGGNQRESKRQ